MMANAEMAAQEKLLRRFFVVAGVGTLSAKKPLPFKDSHDFLIIIEICKQFVQIFARKAGTFH